MTNHDAQGGIRRGPGVHAGLHCHDNRQYCIAEMDLIPPCKRLYSRLYASLLIFFFNQNGEREYSYGLHSRCSAKTGHCVPFPRTTDCDKDASFCNMWRTVGFLMSFGVVVELCTLVSFVVIISGGVQRRVQGWGVVVGVLVFSAVIQGAGMAIVVCSPLLHHDKHRTNMQQSYVFDHDTRFFSGFLLDSSWSMCTASWTLLVLTALGIAASAYYLPIEGDYELIPEMDIEPDDQ